MEITSFQPIFDYIDQTKQDILSEMRETMVTKDEFRGLVKTVEKWILQAADKTKIKYKP